MTSPTQRQPLPFVVGDPVDIVNVAENVGLYRLLSGRTGRVVLIDDASRVVPPLFHVHVSGFTPVPFFAEELRRAVTPPAPLPRLIDCDVCAGSGVMTARSAADMASLTSPGHPTMCPRCNGLGGYLELVADVVTDLSAWVAP